MAKRNHSGEESRPCPHPKLKGFPMMCREPGCRNNYRIQTGLASADEAPCSCLMPDGAGIPCAKHEPDEYSRMMNPDELPGMWEPADVTGGETDTSTELSGGIHDVDSVVSSRHVKTDENAEDMGLTYHNVPVPAMIRRNWDENPPEVAWWKAGVRDAIRHVEGYDPR